MCEVTKRVAPANVRVSSRCLNCNADTKSSSGFLRVVTIRYGGAAISRKSDARDRWGREGKRGTNFGAVTRFPCMIDGVPAWCRESSTLHTLLTVSLGTAETVLVEVGWEGNAREKQSRVPHSGAEVIIHKKERRCVRVGRAMRELPQHKTPRPKQDNAGGMQFVVCCTGQPHPRKNAPPGPWCPKQAISRCSRPLADDPRV